jgi:hypothetical protein
MEDFVFAEIMSISVGEWGRDIIFFIKNYFGN